MKLRYEMIVSTLPEPFFARISGNDGTSVPDDN